MVTLRTYANVYDAGYAHSLLEAAGIPAFLHGEHSYTLEQMPALGGIRLQVAERDLARAREVIADGQPSDELTDFHEDADVELLADWEVAALETPKPALSPGVREGLGRLWAFLKGAVALEVALGSILRHLDRAHPERDPTEFGVYLLIFLAGGVLGIFLRWVARWRLG